VFLRLVRPVAPVQVPAKRVAAPVFHGAAAFLHRKDKILQYGVTIEQEIFLE